jgi:NAD(P)H-dependent flavin oxidoreductase YrpB (nitropropane dioxygenase family)
LGGHLSTRACDLLDCRYPVVLAGMGGVARSELVAAITNAGGFGFLGMVREPPSLIRKEVEAVRRATSQQFGVNLIPAATDSELLERQLHMCIDFGFGSRHELICERNPWHSYLLGTTARVRALRPAIQCCGMR